MSFADPSAPDRAHPPLCLALSSSVLAGAVGLGAVLPVLHLCGVEPIGLPTAILSGHAAVPGVTRAAYGVADITRLGAGLAASGHLARADAVLTGYLADAERAKAVAAIVGTAAPRLLACDPVLGDEGRLYLPEAVADVLCARLLPKADVAMPNLFELGWLTGAALPDETAIARAARALGPAVVFVTSVIRDDQIGILTVTADAAVFAGAAYRARRFNGAGDVTAALLVAGLLRGLAPAMAAAATVRALDRMAALAPDDRDDLPVLAAAPDWLAAFAGRADAP
jgi:pyridoxine kinase